jgi:hypothetical protein
MLPNNTYVSQEAVGRPSVYAGHLVGFMFEQPKTFQRVSIEAAIYHKVGEG